MYNSTADNEVPAKPKFSVQFILLVKIALNNVLELYEVIENFSYFFFVMQNSLLWTAQLMTYASFCNAVVTT